MRRQIVLRRPVLLALVALVAVLIALVALFAGGDPPSFQERVDAAETCAELNEVAADAREAHVPSGKDPEALAKALDDPDSARAKELGGGIADSLAIVTRADQLGC